LLSAPAVIAFTTGDVAMWGALDFRTRTILAGVSAILILGLGLVFSVRRLERMCAEEIARVRDEESEITRVERLRWSGERIVSVGRGYLISGEPDRLERLDEAETTFDRSLLGLRSLARTPVEAQLIGEVERTGNEFRRVQRDVFAARERSDLAAIRERFDNELLPARRDFEIAMKEVVTHKEDDLQRVYTETTQDRLRVGQRLSGLLAVLVLTAFVIIWLSAKRIHLAHLKETEALETARKAVVARDELLGIVAHDLRNPLGAITLKAKVLQKKGETDATRTTAESIEKLAFRMDHLIKSMLDVATIEAGRFTVNPLPCPAPDLLREALDVFEPLAAAKQIRLHSASPDPRLVVWADRERILQVLSNLLGNALKFTPAGGTVAIGAARQDDTVRFSVADSGPGVAPASLDHIYDRFWKDETRREKGTGLGLFIAKGIVDAHGGRIWVDGQPGRGATFYFTLPAGQSAGRAKNVALS
jgi:signal transduction histidine kinase